MNRPTPMMAIATLATLAMIAGCQPMAYKLTPIPVDRTLDETVIHRDSRWPIAKIAMIDVSGMMVDQYQGSLLTEGEHPVSLLAEQLDRAAHDPAVQAIVVRINSPGGTVTAANLMHQQVLDFKARTGKPAIAVMMDVAASGGYLLATACDHIIAHDSTITGSIGVIMQTINFAGTMRKLGIGADAIKSGPYKDAGSPLREMTDNERQLFQVIIDQMRDMFVQNVANGRPNMTIDQVRAAADGRVYLASQALDLGLIDQIGTLDDAITLAKQRTHTTRANVVRYHRPLYWRPNVYATTPTPTPSAASPTINLLNVNWADLADLARPRLLYLWAPSL